MEIKIIGEIGINHNGDLEIAKDLIDVCNVAKVRYIKFQKRNPDICVPENQKNKLKKTPWGDMTYLKYKKKIELSENQYMTLKSYSLTKKISMFSSAWDLDSANFLSKFDTIVKIPSAKITDLELLEFCRDNFDYKIISTGMSYQTEIDKAIGVLIPQVIMHTNSVYPSPVEDLNLGYITWLKDLYGKKYEIGYSSHHNGIQDVLVAIGLGASWIEKHITLDHRMWGSDQKTSLAPHGFLKMCKDIKELSYSLDKGYENRVLYPGEEIKRDSLRGK